MVYEHQKFIKRILRDMNDDIVSDCITEIITEMYSFSDMNFLKEEFMDQLISDDIKTSLLRAIVRSDDFDAYSSSIFTEKINKFVESLNIDNSKLKVYRAITCPYDWVEAALKTKVVKLGECWSYKYDKAIPYCGDERYQKYIFSAEVNLKDINWPYTFLFNLTSIYSKKCEIRLFSNRKVKNFTVEKCGELFTYTFKNNKVFLS